jgi:hypothetical protein
MPRSGKKNVDAGDSASYQKQYEHGLQPVESPMTNELLANAVKYAFPDRTTGKIEINLHAADAEEIELTVRDNGVGLPGDVDVRHVRSSRLCGVMCLF